MSRPVLFFSLLLIALVLAGCATPYVKAQRLYWKGDAVGARETLQPDLDKEVTKNGRAKNLYLWDMGIYCFSQGDYESAIDYFKKSVTDYTEIHGTGKTLKAIFTRASSQKYVGDPIEVSVAYMFLGLAFYMTGDLQNATIALRRSLEEDLCKDAGCEGDMGTTNLILGECFNRVGRLDDAAVAYRRAIEFNPDLMPAYVGLYWALRSQGKTSELDNILSEIEKRAPPAYLEAVTNLEGRGVLLLMFTEKPSSVKKDPLLGAFRMRSDRKPEIQTWRVTSSKVPEEIDLSVADRMHRQFKTQGGASSEAKKQATRLVASKLMQQIPCVGVFAPSTDADVRYWVTMPGYFYMGYIPLEAGTYDLTVSALDKKSRSVPKYGKSWSGIEVKENYRTLVLASGYMSNALY